MRRHRRLVLMDRAVPFLAAFVGLVALGGAVLVQGTVDARTARLSEEIAALRAAVETLAARADQLAAARSDLAPPADDGTIEAMLALQDRMNRLEAEWAERPVTTASTAPAGGAFAPGIGADPAAIDPNWPTTDCIPLGTRFMASAGDELAICQTPVTVKVSAITDDNVMIEDTGVITETAFKAIPGSNCTLTVFSADGAGFAEMRVSCL